MTAIARRVASSVAMLFAVSVLSFALLELAPGDFFAELQTDSRVAPQTVDGLRAQYGLTQSPVVGSYAAAWGTSFSTPFAAGTAALLVELNGWITPSQAADAEGQAVRFSAEVSKGRLHVPTALRAGRPLLRLW